MTEIVSANGGGELRLQGRKPVQPLSLSGQGEGREEEMRPSQLGLVRLHEGKDMMWWEEERLLTEKDKAAIQKAKGQSWMEIDENSAETVIGRRWVHRIAMDKYHRDEFAAGMA